MNVYIVFYNNFDGNDEFCDVFISEEVAQQYINKYDNSDRQQFRIDEYELREHVQ